MSARLAFWGAVIWLVYTLFAGSRRDGDRRATPREIAERRLASGEINEIEFQRIIEALGRGGVSEAASVSTSVVRKARFAW